MADPQITSNGIASQSGRLSLETKFLGACILRLSDEFRTPGAAFAEMNMIATLCEEQNYTTQELLVWGEANLKIAKKWSPGVRELTGIPRSLKRAEAKFKKLRKETSRNNLWPITNTIYNRKSLFYPREKSRARMALSRLYRIRPGSTYGRIQVSLHAIRKCDYHAVVKLKATSKEFSKKPLNG